MALSVVCVGHDEVNGLVGHGGVGSIDGEKALDNDMVSGELDLLSCGWSNAKAADDVHALWQGSNKVVGDLDAFTATNGDLLGEIVGLGLPTDTWFGGQVLVAGVAFTALEVFSRSLR